MSARGSCVTNLSKGAGIVLAAAFVVLLPVGLVAQAFGSVVFSPEEIAIVVGPRLAEADAFRQAFAGILLGGETRGPGLSDLSRALGGLDPRELDAALEALVPEGWAREQAGNMLTDLYAWLDDPRPMPDLAADLRPLKEHLLGGGAEALVEIVVDSWPACSLEQVEEMTRLSAETGEVPILYCEPPEPFRSLLSGFATAAIEAEARSLPAEWPLGRDLVLARSTEDALAFKEQLRTLRVLTRSGWLLAMSLLGLVMAVAIRSWGRLGRWWGTSLIAAGVLTMMLGLALGGMVARALAQTDPGSQDPAGVARLLPALVAAIADGILGRVVIAAIVAALAGVLLLVIGNRLAKREAE
jgi:hypothetical protein